MDYFLFNFSGVQFHYTMSPKNPFQFFNQNGNRKVADLCFLSKNQPLISHSSNFTIELVMIIPT